jgi:hypothetical protein
MLEQPAKTKLNQLLKTGVILAPEEVLQVLF